MAKINQIQKALKELDGAIFQKMSDSYLLRKGYSQINPIGSVIGKTKTKTGTPDTLIPLPNDKYVFVEYTTLGKGVFNKFIDDLEKCFDESKTCIPINKIQEIVLCFNTELDTKEIEGLRKICENAGVNLNLFGNGTISFDLLEKYPHIAKDYLGIEVDTGQIVPLEQFIKLYETSKLATTLQTSFYFREEERKQINSLIQNEDLVIISGAAGTGKTRIAIECFRDFIEGNESYKGFCIYNQGIDFFEDIKSNFSDCGDYIIFVDDANRISGFKYIIQLLQTKRDDQNFKIIVTVRDYALSKIQEDCKSVSGEEISIEKFSDDEIKSLLREEFLINNHSYLDRICEISNGNPRLAIMAAKIANDANSLVSIRDVSDVYDSYYASIKSDIEILNDPNLLRVAGIVAFFRIVDRTNEKLMLEIEKHFSIASDDFWEYAKQLHDMEVFDMFEDEVVKVSDQVLATYLFYLIFFKEELIKFSILLTNFFPNYKQRLIDAINPVINSFNYETTKETMVTSVDKVWSDLQDSDEQTLIELIDVFWFLKPTDALVYFKKKVDALEIEDIPIDKINFEPETNSELPKYLSCLPNLRMLGPDELSMSLDLLFKFVEKQSQNTPTILNVLINKYGFEPESYQYGYYVQKKVIDKLIEYIGKNNNELFTHIFICVAGNFLQTQFSVTRSGRGRTFNITRFSPSATDELLSLRKKIFKALFNTYETHEEYRDEILRIPISDIPMDINLIDNSIVFQDSELLIPFFVDHLNSENLNHCLIVQKFFRYLESMKVSVNIEVREKFSSEIYKLYDLLTNRVQKRELELSTVEFNEYKKNKTFDFIRDYTQEDYDHLFKQLQILKSDRLGKNTWSLDQGINTVFEELADRNSKLFLTVLEEYLQQGDYLTANHWIIVPKLVLNIGALNALDVISKYEFEAKDRWTFSCYEVIPMNEIQESFAKELCILYENTESSNLPQNFDYLQKYENLSVGLIENIVFILVNRSASKDISAHSLYNLFNSHTNIHSCLLHLFSNKNLLEDAYLALSNCDPSCDYGGKSFSLLLDNRQEFLAKYIDDKFSREGYISSHDENKDYSFLWERKDVFSLMIIITDKIYDYHVEERCHDYYKIFFNRNVHPQTDKKILAKQDEFLIKLIENKFDDIDYLEFVFLHISDFESDRRLKFYKTLLDNNNNFELFKKLQLGPSIWMGDDDTGNFVPAYQREVGFLQELASICNSVELLKHRQYLEQNIKNYRDRIMIEKKRDFTEIF